MTANDDQELQTSSDWLLEAEAGYRDWQMCTEHWDAQPGTPPIELPVCVLERWSWKLFIPSLKEMTALKSSARSLFNTGCPEVKKTIVSKLEEQVEANLGTAMVYTLFEWAKENQQQLMETHHPVNNALTLKTSSENSLQRKREKKSS
ncbi:RWD domain-containing protein 4-like [Polyodon spathula]|uniref:RWD domain-containing protein 4-like n=1 Tax=Polyodon spathula TaxID=7913 RepID=UPI001B7E5A38|nr:RWD domain-containing protein 4-like [Polyodon spathula]